MLGGRYRVSERIGNGGMAEVFRATDQLLGRDVAVKVFRSVGPTDDSGGAQRQERELQALARLSHPHLITLFDASITDQPPYLVMELVEGPNLAARIAQGPLPENEVRVIGAQIADALAYVHSNGMVHRDVKPANILLGEDCYSSDSCRARLSDFGIVRLLGSERMTAADFTLGTASYLAPEQARGGDVTPAADVYSLGLVLIEALTATRSFDGPPVEAVLARLARDPEIPAGIPAPLAQLLTAMTTRDPAARPAPAHVSRALRAGLQVAPIAPVAAVGSRTDNTADSAVTTVIETPHSGPVQLPANAAPMAAWVAADENEDVAPVADRRRGGMFAVAALVSLLIIGAASWLAFGSSPSGHPSTPAGGVQTSTQPHAPRHATTHVNAVIPQPNASHPSSAAPATHSAAPAVRHSSPPSTAAAPTTSAVPSSSVAPPTTSAAPPTTSAAASTAGVAAVAPVPSPTPSN